MTAILNALTQAMAGRWSPVLLDAAGKSLAVMVLACAAISALRRCSAAMRHLLWTLAILSLVLLIVLSAALPAWRVLPGWAAPVPAPPVRVEAYEPPPPSLSPTLDSLAAAPPQHVSVAVPVTGQNVSPLGPSGLEESPAAEPPRLPISQCLLLAWAVGTLLSLLLLALGLPGLWLLHRGTRRVYVGPLADELGRLRARLGIARPVALLVGKSGTMPMTWGARRPCILLPIEAGQWPADRLRVVLLHELAHIKRHDCLVHLLARTVCAIYWFNPLAWYALRRLRVECERASDDLVLAAGTSISDYAEHLLHVATGFQGFRRFQPGGLLPSLVQPMARRSTLEGRVTAILDKSRNRRGLTRAAVLLAGIALALAVVPVAMLRAQEGAVPPAKAPSTSATSVSITTSITWKATLPGGGEVELLGVSDRPGSNATWWKPDGSPLATHPITSVWSTGFNPRSNEKMTIFVFRTQGLPNDASLTFSSAQGSGWWSMRAGWKPKEHAADLLGLLTVLPSSVETSKVSVGVAAGPWITVFETNGIGERSTGTSSNGFCFSPASEIAGAITITAAHNLRDTDNRIIAVDMNGKEYLATQNSVGANGINMVTCIFPGLVKNRVKTFQLQTRPYTWVKFTNVAVSRGQATHVGVSVGEMAGGDADNLKDAAGSSPSAATGQGAQNLNTGIANEASAEQVKLLNALEAKSRELVANTKIQDEEVKRLLRRAADLRHQQNYDGSLELLNQALCLQPNNVAAQAMKEMVEDSSLYARTVQLVRNRDLLYAQHRVVGVDPASDYLISHPTTITSPLYFVRLVVASHTMTFEGQKTTWEDLPLQLAQTPDRHDTVLELAMDSGNTPMRQVYDTRWRVENLAKVFGFEYLDGFISVKDLGTKGSPPKVRPTGAQPKTPAAPLGLLRHFVRLVVGSQSMTFEGQETTWKDLSALLAQVPDRPNTVVEFAIDNDEVTLNRFNDAQIRALNLTSEYGFEYLSDVGVREPGSKGSPPRARLRPGQ